MTRETIQAEVLALLKDCKDIEVTDFTTDLFSKPYYFAARDLTYVLSAMQDKHQYDLNDVVRTTTQYSVQNIVDALYLQNK